MLSKYTSNKCYVFPVKNDLRAGKYCEKNIAILIHIHYWDTIEYYLPYILNVPDGVDVYISTSEYNIEKKSKDLLNMAHVAKFIHKENRGRDISAFLVAARKELLHYEYIGFVHDKRAHVIDEEEDVNGWIHSLWHNMLASKDYVQCVFDCFENNKNVGLLIPPVFLGNKKSFAISNTWLENFENVLSLLGRINVNVKIDKSEYPMTIGTVFWARTVALKKLLSYQWSYEDFPPEPLPMDGTISHAIERSLEYVARDAGFQTMWIMSDEYAAYQYEQMRSAMKNMLFILREFHGINNLYRVDKIKNRINNLQKFVSKCINMDKKVLIYGAGVIGIRVNKILKNINITVKAHVVTVPSSNINNINGIKVIGIDELRINESYLFVVAVARENMIDEIKKTLLYRGVLLSNIYIW